MTDTETEEFTIDELKKQYADIGLVKAICDYMEGAKGTPYEPLRHLGWGGWGWPWGNTVAQKMI